MTATWETALATALCAAACSQLGLAQVASPTILQIDVENQVQYQQDASDPSKFATDPNAVAAVLPKNFNFALVLADIVAVNGQPAKGTFTRNVRVVFLNSAPSPGQSIADTVRNTTTVDNFEILKSDGAAVGTIMASGLAGGSPAPGAPLSITTGNFAIMGGTGAFLGARGQVGAGPQTVPARAASVTEDPSNRRRNGGGRQRYVLHVIPMEQPQILTTNAGPVAFHSDFSAVTAAKPARAGEVLITMATGLGPTRPGVDPGQPFPSYPANPLQLINSPVAATVNGQSAPVINAVGWPGLVDTYRVDVQVPGGIATGMAAIQLSAAWIVGPSVNIPIQ